MARRLARACSALVLAAGLLFGLLLVLPAALGWQRYVITSGSITGTYDRGSLVLDEVVPVSELRAGARARRRPLRRVRARRARPPRPADADHRPPGRPDRADEHRRAVARGRHRGRGGPAVKRAAALAVLLAAAALSGGVGRSQATFVASSDHASQ